MNEHRSISAAEAEERRLEALIASLPPCPGLPSTPEEIAASDAAAEEDIAAGRVVPHSVVREWLDSWRNSEYRSFEEWFAERDG
jgi:hypothetical protein